MFQCYNNETYLWRLIHDVTLAALVVCLRYHCQYGPKDNASHIPVVTKEM